MLKKLVKLVQLR